MIYWHLRRWHAQPGADSWYTNVNDLTKLKVQGGNLQKFASDWSMCFMSIDNYPPPASMESLLMEQQETVPRFSTCLEYYLLKYASAKKNNDELYCMMLNFIDEERIGHNKKQRANATARWTPAQSCGPPGPPQKAQKGL